MDVGHSFGTHSSKSASMVTIKIVTDSDLHEHMHTDGGCVDLVDFSKINSFEVSIDSTMRVLKEAIATGFGVPVENQLIWMFRKRKNGTWRPSRALTPNENEYSVRYVLQESNDDEIKLLLVHPKDIPENHNTSDLLVFLKYYDPNEVKMRCLGAMFVYRFNMLSDIIKEIKQRACITEDVKFDLYEEIRSEPYMFCHPLLINKTFSANEIVSGDIICCQRQSAIKHPSLELFLQTKAAELKIKALQDKISMLKTESDDAIRKAQELTEGKFIELTDLLNSRQLKLSTIAPAYFFCPISQELMKNPVVAADGFSYEHDSIATWLKDNDTSPYGNPLPNKVLIPNLTLRSAIFEYNRLAKIVD